MHDSLLVGQAGAGEPSPLQARVTDVNDQNHAEFVTLKFAALRKRARIASSWVPSSSSNGARAR
jgi:hypothetical protein